MPILPSICLSCISCGIFFFTRFIFSLADSKGELQLMSGSIQPIDVWHSRGVRYHVQFNELNQPIRKGGHILVRFLGSVAKDGTYCPIGEKNWHHVDVKLKTKIVMKMRVCIQVQTKIVMNIYMFLISYVLLILHYFFFLFSLKEHFVIPEDEVYDTLALQRVSKCWRHYKHSLKLTFFKPDKLTEEEHYDIVPSGHTRSEWKPLVQYWFSVKGQQLSQLGKAARGAQNQVHTLGSTSYANIRANYEDEHGEEMSLIELWEPTHKRKDGTYLEGTDTSDFLEDAKAKVDSLKLCNPSMSRVDVENEAFQTVMNGDVVPERPQGYGFGVKKSDGAWYA
ncbi:uncharacterized protein LOC130590316 isoform X1 [Beta vulgaris subsp. vulgaris]|uniref:uncharacterized protein LOC130590316 isoform X1 n=1 Tax=Beta vulgaris subsp. vulgaris TaxID=3555 RepID=UPI002547E1F8|nr:uncharacterized protein LOC130590316 isoform X1 [Beta vulgaris subsp. vulgaris]